MEDGYLDVAAEPEEDGLYEELDNGFGDLFAEPAAAEPSSRALENPSYDTLPGMTPEADRSTVQSNPAYDSTPGAFDLMPNPAYTGAGDDDDGIYQDAFDLNDLEAGGASNPMMNDDTYFDPKAIATPSDDYGMLVCVWLHFVCRCLLISLLVTACHGLSRLIRHCLVGFPDAPTSKPIAMTTFGNDPSTTDDDDDVDVKPIGPAPNTRKYKLVIAVLIVIILGLLAALIATSGDSSKAADPSAAQSAGDRNNAATTANPAETTSAPPPAPPTSSPSNCTQGCGSNGYCSEPLSTCLCNSGYFGALCNQTCSNLCTSPARGVCGGDGICACVSGFEGSSCERSVASFLGTFRNSASGALGDINQDNMKSKLNELEPTTQFSLGQCVLVTGALQCEIKVSTADGMAAPVVDRLMAAAKNNSIELYNGGFKSVQKDAESESFPLEAQCPFDCSGNGK